MKSKSGIVIAPVRANAGVRMKYQTRLDNLIKAMREDVIKEISAVYAANESKIAQDAAVDDIMATAKSLFKHWEARFLKDDVANWFVNTTLGGVFRQINGNLKEASGLTLKTPPMSKHLQTLLKAATAENTSLIRSIPQQYLEGVERLVLECVKRGKDLKFLTDALEERYGAEIDKHFTGHWWKSTQNGYKGAREHAALIARDQTNKVTQLIANTRYAELGITKAVWLHSGAGRVPRVTHEKFDEYEFDINQGLYDTDVKKYVLPGELINCRCTSAPVVPFFGEV